MEAPSEMGGDGDVIFVGVIFFFRFVLLFFSVSLSLHLLFPIPSTTLHCYLVFSGSLPVTCLAMTNSCSG